MPHAQPLDHIPLWGMFVATMVISLLSIEGGFRLGDHRRRCPEHERDTPVGAIVTAVLGLLAFMLAITFGFAAARYDDRRRAVVDEANAIGTTYLRAAFLPEPDRTRIRDLLREYVTVRVDAVQRQEHELGVVKSEQLQDRLWAQAAAVGGQNPGSIMAGLFIQSLNEVIDMHTRRVEAGLSRIPVTIWLVLYLEAILAMAAMGYLSGLGGSRGLSLSLVLTLTFSAVLLLIIDLDRSREGFLRVSQHAMVSLKDKLAAPTPETSRPDR